MIRKSFILFIVSLVMSVFLVGAANAQTEGSEYIVQADDWLSKVAEKNYGDVLAWPVIWEATNAMSAEDDSFAFIEDPNVIEIGQKLWIPDVASAEALLTDREEFASLDISIAFMGPLTGGAAFLGQEQLNFAKVAVEIFNEETGFNIQLVEGDTMIDPDEARIVAERFIADDSIVAVVGPSGSQVCEAVQPLFEEAGIAHVTPSCTRISLTEPGTATFFRPIPTDGDQGPTDATYMIDVLGVESAYLVDDQSSYSTGLTDEVEAALMDAGVTDIERASVTQEDSDFSSLVTTIVSAGSDVVFFPGQISSQLGTLAAQLAEQNYEGIYFLGDGGFDISWVETAGDAAEGTYLSFFAPDPRYITQAREYTSRYEAEYGEFGAFGGPSALSARILLEAIQRCIAADDTSRECAVRETAATDMADSLLGIPVSFGEGNQIESGDFFIFQVQDGNFVLVQ